MTIPDHQLLATACAWHDAGRKTAIATVVSTWGSAPRATGSLLVIDQDGAIEGSVSGGCVEGAVITAAIDAIADGEPRLLDFGVSDDDAFAVGLACGGEISVLVEPIGPAISRSMLGDLAQNAPVAYVVDLDNFKRRVAKPAEFPDQFRLDRSGIAPGTRTFIGIHNPPLRMFIIGAVHIAQPLAEMARACDFLPTIIDPRSVFGAAARFPDDVLSDDWPDAALENAGIDARTAIVTLAHDPKLDDPALQVALRSPAFYIGSLGSKRTHAKRVTRLTDAGFTDAEIARINGPVGLQIGGRKPAEIALSIMSQVIATLRQSD